MKEQGIIKRQSILELATYYSLIKRRLIRLNTEYHHIECDILGLDIDEHGSDHYHDLVLRRNTIGCEIKKFKKIELLCSKELDDRAENFTNVAYKELENSKIALEQLNAESQAG